MASDHERDDRPRRRHDERDSGRRETDRRSRNSHRDDERRRSRDGRRRSRSPGESRRRRRSREREGDGHGRRRRSREDTDDRKRRRHRHDDDGNSSEDLDRAVAKRKSSPLRRKGPLPSQQDSFAVTRTPDGGGEPDKPKEKPNWGNTGRLAALSNSVAQSDGSTIVLKYHEPPEARKPPLRDDWKLFVFKGGDVVDTIPLSGRSCWLVGREMAVVDLPAEHPSVSKQHAVIQFRYTEKRNEFGDKIGKVKPYIIDLESANGTVLNDGRIPGSRYLELRDKDIVQFGQSTREYVVMLAPRD